MHTTNNQYFKCKKPIQLQGGEEYHDIKGQLAKEKRKSGREACMQRN